MNPSGLSQWFWPILSFVLLVLWLWTLVRQGKERRSAAASRYQQIEAEDVLKAAYATQKEQGRLNGKVLAGATNLPKSLTEQALAALVAFDWAKEDEEGHFQLTDEGTARAQELIRAHRLWECHLVDREGMSLDAVHAEAHRREHETTEEELERLDAELGHPAWDPHGHAIPAPKSRMPSAPGHPLSSVAAGAEEEPGRRWRIVSLDDEPAPLLAQLVALGLEPGADIEVVDQEQDLLQVRIGAGPDRPVIPLARPAAHHVCVVAAPTLTLELGDLPVGARAKVVEIVGGGKHQRRMLDMGFVPGAEVAVMRKASLGDPIEYRVKGTGVAMRRSDANSIMVEEVSNG